MDFYFGPPTKGQLVFMAIVGGVPILLALAGLIYEIIRWLG